MKIIVSFIIGRDEIREHNEPLRLLYSRRIHYDAILYNDTRVREKMTGKDTAKRVHLS